MSVYSVAVVRCVMWESPLLAISKGYGKRGREDSFIVLPSTLSIRPAFPPPLVFHPRFQ
jgi:hypothetical protein